MTAIATKHRLPQVDSFLLFHPPIYMILLKDPLVRVINNHNIAPSVQELANFIVYAAAACKPEWRLRMWPKVPDAMWAIRPHV